MNISLDIHIHAARSVVWAYMSDIPMALGHNRLHRDIIPLGSSHARTGHAFIITHRTFFGVNQMNAVIRECLPPERLQVEESCKNQRLTGFTHTSTFLLTPSAKGTKMM